MHYTVAVDEISSMITLKHEDEVLNKECYFPEFLHKLLISLARSTDFWIDPVVHG
jgi:hypothetical protein